MENQILDGLINEYKDLPLKKIADDEFKYGRFPESDMDGAWVLIKKDSNKRWYYIRLGNVSESKKFDSLLELLDVARADIARAKL